MKETEIQALSWVCLQIDPENPHATESLEDRCVKAIKELHAILNNHVCDNCDCLGNSCDGDNELCFHAQTN